MADHKIGTVFVELDLDPSRYTKGQQQLYKDATQTTLNIEANFKKLGISSSAEMDLMRAKIKNSFDMIANSSKATANDIIRAEEAKNAKLSALNKQQFGEQKTLLDNLKAHWIAAGAAIGTAMIAVNQIKEFTLLGAKALQAEESFQLVTSASGIMADQLIADMKRVSAGTVDDSDIMQKAVKGIVLGLKDNEMVRIMEAARISARVAGEDVKTAYENITDAISTGMPKALKRYGLITKEEMALVNAALKAGVADVDLYSIAMMNAEIQAGKFGEVHTTAAENIQIFKAALNDAKESIGKWFLDLGKFKGEMEYNLSLTTSFDEDQALGTAMRAMTAEADKKAAVEKIKADMADLEAKKKLAEEEKRLEAERKKMHEQAYVDFLLFNEKEIEAKGEAMN
jgi:hypothetical protein